MGLPTPGLPIPATIDQITRLAGGEPRPDPVLIRSVEGVPLLVTLIDADLPEQGVERGATTRLVTTRYPGRSSASTQVMGIEELPLTLSGWFRDGWVGAAGWARQQDAALRALQLAQRQVEVTWGATWTVRGYVRSYKATWTRPQDCRYEVIIDVSEADDAVVMALPGAFPPAPSAGALAALLAAMDAAAEAAVIAVALSNAVQAVI